MKRTIIHATLATVLFETVGLHHLGHVPLRDVRVECFSKSKHCRVKKGKERERSKEEKSERTREMNCYTSFEQRKRGEIIVEKKKKN